MASVITAAWIEARIVALQAMIEAYESAIVALTTGGQRSYTINTGQTSQSVTANDLSTLQARLDSAIARLEMWDQRLNGGPEYFRSFS